jgi:lysophospholipase L1-like esterase
LRCYCRDSAEARRQQLNALIRGYAKLQQTVGDKAFHTISLEHELDWRAMTEQRKKRLFEDGLHFTKYGYRELGRLMYESLVKVLELDG